MTRDPRAPSCCVHWALGPFRVPRLAGVKGFVFTHPGPGFLGLMKCLNLILALCSAFNRSTLVRLRGKQVSHVLPRAKKRLGGKKHEPLFRTLPSQGKLFVASTRVDVFPRSRAGFCRFGEARFFCCFFPTSPLWFGVGFGGEVYASLTLSHRSLVGVSWVALGGVDGQIFTALSFPGTFSDRVSRIWWSICCWERPVVVCLFFVRSFFFFYAPLSTAVPRDVYCLLTPRL